MENVLNLAAGADMADIRKRGRETQTLVLIAFVLAVVSIVGEIVIGPVVQLLQGDPRETVIADARNALIEIMPMAILLSGLWSAHRVFGRVANGEVFVAANAAGMSEIGQSMGWCGFAQCVMVPTIKAWVNRTGGFDFNLEGWAIVLAVLGGAVILFGRIWALAVEMKVDADQII